MEQSEVREQRIYIGNLTKDVKLSQLLSVLPTGYDKTTLEIRHNYDIDKNITSSFAFLNYVGNQSEIKTWCINASKKSINGNVLQVQFAKLSFLERLKQEFNSVKKKNDPVKPLNENSNAKFKINNPNLVKFDSGQSSSSSCESDTEQAGVEENDPSEKPLKVLGKGSMRQNEKVRSDAELKRMESLMERSSAHVNKQKIIRMAIKTMTSDNSKKIVFKDSDEEEVENSVELDEEVGLKRKLFAESDSDSDQAIDFSNSKPKTKLIRTKVSAVDERFRMDSRFFDGEEEEKQSDVNLSSNEEHNKIMEIANAIIKKDPNARTKVKIKKDVNSVIIPTRFDPLQKQHHSLIIQREEDIIASEPNKVPVALKPFRVEKQRFYDVSDNLKDQFKKEESSGFSLLGLFGDEPDKKRDTPQEDVVTKIKTLKNPLDNETPNFFNVNEDSDVEDDAHKSDSAKGKINWNEPLFLPLTDPRVEEALKFFNTPLQETLPHAVISRDLKSIVKKKYLRNLSKSKMFKTKLGSQKKVNKLRGRKKKHGKVKSKK